MQPRKPGLLAVDFSLEFAERTVKHRHDIVSDVLWFEIKLFQASRKLLEGFIFRRKAAGQSVEEVRISESW